GPEHSPDSGTPPYRRHLKNPGRNQELFDGHQAGAERTPGKLTVDKTRTGWQTSPCPKPVTDPPKNFRQTSDYSSVDQGLAVPGGIGQKVIGECADHSSSFALGHALQHDG